MGEQKRWIGAEQIELIRGLSNASGVSGMEGEVREMVKGMVKPLADEMREDVLGNLIVRRGGGEGKLKVMLAAHMDEVGVVVTVDEGEGLYQVEQVGGIDVRQMVGKAVRIGKGKVAGVIGARAIHLTTEEQRRSAIPLEMLRVDVGLGGKVGVGERGVFATECWTTERSIFGKALDDRLGVATLIELLKVAPQHLELYAVFTTQEEIGLRGAMVAADQIHPHIGIAVDSTPAYDFPAVKDKEVTTYNTQLGKGPAIYTMDRATLSDPRLIRLAIETAIQHGIPYQIRQAGGGGTDAGSIHLQHEGIPSLSISVPGRHPHTAVGIAYIEDWEHTIALLSAMLQDLNWEILTAER